MSQVSCMDPVAISSPVHIVVLSCMLHQSLTIHAVSEYCLPSVSSAVKRLILAAFTHANEMHLSYNMISLLWKGRRLETQIGPERFAVMCGLFAVLSNIMIVVLGWAAYELLDWPFAMHQCSAGFSAVLFALKVVLTYHVGGHQRLMYTPFAIPSRYIAWAELLLFSLLFPRVSFLGHLSGILVGLAYVHGLMQPIFAGLETMLYAGPNDHFHHD
jgi:rhomboid-related protein 4